MILSERTESVYARQIAFLCAFLLPASKLLEAPSLLAKYAEGDLLVPAAMHFLLQGGLLFVLLTLVMQSEQTLFERLEQAIGKWLYPVYALFVLFYLFYAVLPLLDLEKFTYAAFSDTEPTFFNFSFFFFLSAFLCTKTLKSVGRSGDLCLFLFPLPFLALLGMSLAATEFSHLLPWFGTDFKDTVYAFTYTTPHFSDVVLLLPLLVRLKGKKGDRAKIMTGYGVGAVLTLLFLAVFFGVYSSIAQKEHYAFSKIAQYFPALAVLGRVDLLFIYLLSVVLLYFTILPLQYATGLTHALFPKIKRIYLSFALNLGAFIFALFCNKYYNRIYAFMCGKAFFVFWLVAYLLPLSMLFLYKYRSKKTYEKGEKI